MSKKIRLAVVSDAVHPWHTGGKETRYEQLLKRLPEKNIEVTIYTMRWWDKAPPRGDITYKAISKKYSMYTNSRRSMKQGILFALTCFKLLLVKDYDVIEADHMPYLQLFPLKVVSLIKKVPLVVTWHEVWGETYWEKYLGGLAGKIASKVEYFSSKLPDQIVAVSTETADQLNRLGVPYAKIHVMWAGVNVDELDKISPVSDASEVLFAGRLIEHKRVDLIISAIARLRDKGLNYKLSIVGDGPERQRLENISESLHLKNLVKFHGSLENVEEVWAYMKSSKVFAFPSEREGFGLAVAESLAAGTPCVVVDHRANASKELIDEGLTGSIINTGDVAGLAEAIEYWVSHPNEHHMQGVRFETRHPHLSWDGLAERYAKLLSEVVL